MPEHQSRSALLMVQPSASHYRAPLMRALLADEKLEYALMGRITGKRATVAAPADERLLARVAELRRQVLVGPLFWDRGLLRRVLTSKADVTVLEGNVYGLSTWLALWVLRLRKRKVAFWGHGWKRPERGLKLRLRATFYRLADAHLVYGNWAREFAGEVGLDMSRFHCVYNSVYENAQVLEQARYRRQTDSTRRSTFVFSGRLTVRHGVASAVSAIQTLRRSGHEARLVIVGDGPEMGRLRELAGDKPGVIFRGAVYDFDALQDIYAEADFALSPGASGLNVVQALSFGVPVIAGEGHPDSGPEIEAVRNGDTGLLYDLRRGADGLVAAMLEALNYTDNAYSRLSRGGLDLVRAHYTAERQADAISEALRRTLAD